MDAESMLLREPVFSEDPAKFMQLTPTIPPSAHQVPVIQAGRYGALWIRLAAQSSCAVTATDLNRWMEECEGYEQGAVYVALPQVR